ncbi:MAG: lipopolysaccharide biosynthesis protein [bacterium]
MQESANQTITVVESPQIKKSSFAGDVLKLVSGTTFAQGLLVLASPLLARLYAPEDFGVLALYISITSIVGVIACLRYELAIMLPESDGEAANLLGVSLLFTAVITGLSTLVIWLWGESLLLWLNAPGMTPYLWLIPLTILLDGVFHALNYWNSRTKHFGRLSIAPRDKFSINRIHTTRCRLRWYSHRRESDWSKRGRESYRHLHPGRTNLAG